MFQFEEVKDVVTTPGLHFKWPLIQRVRAFDMRILTFDDAEPLRFITSEKKPVLGLPGCARSPKINGFDWVLERLCAGLPVGREDIMRMGAGGLLAEIPSRPLPHDEAMRNAPRSANGLFQVPKIVE